MVTSHRLLFGTSLLLAISFWTFPHMRALLPGNIVILFAVSVTKVKCILRSKVLLQRQVNIRSRWSKTSKWSKKKYYNCIWKGLNQVFNGGTNTDWNLIHPVLYHYAIEALLYLANLCYICHLWPNWEMHLHLFNMGHMIYVLDWFFDVNLMVGSILQSD